RPARYGAIQRYFTGLTDEGLRMMRLSCALQISLDAGLPEQVGRRWHLANLLTPVLIGMFANSPFAAGQPGGWKSARAAMWRSVDPSRTGTAGGLDGPDGYLQVALNAGVLLRRGEGRYRSGTP